MFIDFDGARVFVPQCYFRCDPDIEIINSEVVMHRQSGADRRFPLDNDHSQGAAM